MNLPIIFWAGVVLIILGFILVVVFGEKALSKAYNPGRDRGIFYAGVGCIAGGILFFMIVIYEYIKDNKGLNKKIVMLEIDLNQCKGGSSKSSGPGWWSKFKGFFSRKTSVPPAGNPGEVNPFLNQE